MIPASAANRLPWVILVPSASGDAISRLDLRALRISRDQGSGTTRLTFRSFITVASPVAAINFPV